MKILMIAGNPFTNFMSTGVSILSALVKQKGYEFVLFDLCSYDFGVSDENKIGENLLEFKKVNYPEKSPKYKKKPKKSLIEDFMKVIGDYQPDIIGLSVFSADFIFGKYLLSQIKKDINIPVIVGGIHPTVAPEKVIIEEWVDMINIGYGEESFIELLDSYFKNGKYDTSVKNIWFKEKGEVIKNTLRPIMKNFDVLPYLDWTIYEDYHFYRPFVGDLYRYGSIEISRGCPFTCKFCVNSYLPEIYGVHSYNSKSVNRAIDEIVFLKENYNLEFLRLQDENFLLKKLEYLMEFGKKYQEKVKLPFIISTTATTVTKEKVEILKNMNCVNVGLGVETGNEALRMNILDKNVPDVHYAKAFRLLNDAGIRTAAQLMFGVPHETVDDYIETIRKIKEWNVDTAHVATFYPFKGSKLREYAINIGLLNENEIEDFEKNNYIATRENLSLLKFSDEQFMKMNHYRRLFTVYKEMPEWLWPLVDECGKDNNEFSNELEGLLRKLVAKKRFS